jgi:hypothetical protein
MRRVSAAVAVLALPAALAVAQVPANPGQVLEPNNFDVTTGLSFINAAHCDGATLDLAWQVTLLQGASFATADRYDIYASNTAPFTQGENVNFCPTADDDSTNPDTFADDVATFPAQGITQGGAVDPVLVASATRVSCDATSENEEVFICAHLLSATSARLGFASGKFRVQVEAPVKPVISGVGSGDGRLEVRWDPGTGGVDADSYVASASTVAGGRAVASATTDAESVTIGGLANFTTYSVTVRAISVGGNLSDPSFAVSGTPAPSAGFLEVYGGVEKGGCSTGTAGALALLGTALVLAVRRRVR